MNREIVKFKYKLITWAIHLLGVLFALWAIKWMQLKLSLLTTFDWVSTGFVVLAVLYLAAITMRIFNGAHPAPAAIQQHFEKNHE